MKVILKETVKKLGEKGDLVEASDGYARNFLIPRGMAEEATPSKIKQLKQKIRSEEKKLEAEAQAAESVKKHLQDKKVVVKASSGETGRLFGSVTSAQVSKAINEQFNVEVDKKDVRLPDVIRTIGDHEFSVKLHPGVEAGMKLSVEGE